MFKSFNLPLIIQVNCEIVLQYACEDTLDPQVDNFWPWVTGKAGEFSPSLSRILNSTEVHASAKQ